MRRNTGDAASSSKAESPRRLSKPDSSSDTFALRRGRLGIRELDHITQRYADLYDFAPTGYVSFDRSGRIEEINLTAAQLFKMHRERLIGMPFTVFVYREDITLFLHHLSRCRNAEASVETELRLKNSKRQIIHAVLSSTPIAASMRNGAVLFQTAIVDVTERKRAEQQLLMRDGVSRALAESGSLQTAAARIIQAICDAVGWESGAVWDINRATKKLHCVDFWHRPSITIPLFEADSRKETFRRGIGLPGRVWQSGKPAWVPDVTQDDNFPRASTAAKDGVHAGLGFPIKLGNQLLGVVECFSREIRQPDNELLQMFMSVGSQIGQFVKRKKAEEALRETEAELELIVTRTPFMLTRCTRDLRYCYASRAYAEMLGRKPEEIAGKPIVQIMGKRGLAAIRPYVERALSGETVTYEANVSFRNRQRHFLRGVYVPDVNEQGDIIGWIASLVDLTEQKRAEDRFRLAVESSPSGMIMVDQNGKIILVNSQAERLFGYRRAELIGKSIDMLVPQRFRHQHGDYRAGFSSAPQARAMGKGRDLYGLRKDGKEVPVEIGLNPIRMGGQTVILSSIVDITERKKAEAALWRSKELLEQRVRDRTRELYRANKELESEIERRKGLEGEILSVSDREQQRLGQELHDGLCQHLTAVAFMARSMSLRLRNHRVIDAADIDKIAELVNDAAVDSRNLSRALHRSDIDSAGLMVALQDLVDREIWRTPCRLEMKPSFRIENDAVAAHLYRIAREAVINANKHARARQIIVRLERFRREMVLRVIDDGVGFPKDLKPQQGLGYHIMNYRAQLIGGRLEVESRKSGGTRVSCYLPDRPGVSGKEGANGQRTGSGRPVVEAIRASDRNLRHLTRGAAANG